jgi:hypothetical protein
MQPLQNFSARRPVFRINFAHTFNRQSKQLTIAIALNLIQLSLELLITELKVLRVQILRRGQSRSIQRRQTDGKCFGKFFITALLHFTEVVVFDLFGGKVSDLLLEE